MTDRRRFLKLSLGSSMVAALGSLAGRIGGIAPVRAAVPGERAGFVILTDPEAPVPSGVTRPPEWLTAPMENLGEVKANTHALFEFRRLPLAEAAGAIRRPFYALAQPPSSLRAGPVEVITHISGTVVEAALAYELSTSDLLQPEPVVMIRYQEPHMKPFPVWPGRDQSGASTAPYYVDFLPRSGVVTPALSLEVGHWITERGLYTVWSDVDKSGMNMRDIANTMTEI